MDMNKWMGVFRHIVTTAGGILTVTGMTTVDQAAALTSNIETIAGAVMVVGGIAASIFSKNKKNV